MYEFQRRMLADYFGGVTETVILVSKKNGKTTLLAALALHHLLVTSDAECVIAASSRDQAQILLNQARGFVRRSGLSKYMTVKQREIVSLKDEGRVRVMASDSDTADGVIPTLAIVDELHRHKDSGAMYGVFADGLGPREGRIVTISTAGDDEESALGRLRRKAHMMRDVERDGAYVQARSDDGEFVLHEWALDVEQDRDDLEVVKGANPAPWQTVEALRKRRDSPSMTPWRWARFACGVWLKGEGKWMTTAQGVYAGRERFELPPRGSEVVLAWDPSLSFDSCAIVAVHVTEGRGLDDQKRRRATAWPVSILKPQEQDGGTIPDWRVKEAVLAAAEEWKVAAIGWDKHRGFKQVAEALEQDHSLMVVTVPSSADVWAPLTADLLAAFTRGAVATPGETELDLEFTRHILNGEVKDTPHGERLHGRTKDRSKVDGLMALGMGWWLAFDADLPSPSVYEDRGILVLSLDD